MNIVSCLNPQRIINKYTGEVLHVPCRKCSACMNMKQQEMINRLQYERQKWPYCVFFTLTYAPEFCPKYVLEHDGNDVVFCRSGYVDSLSNGVSFSEVFDEDGTLYPYTRLSELPDVVRNDDASLEVLDRAFSTDSEFRVVDKSHAQKFIKRLRFHINKYFPDAHFRYFLCSEYGCDKTDNYRPHYHGLWFFDSEKLAKSSYKILCETWKLGFVGASFARSNAVAYVAKYVNSLSYYPKIYESFLAKPFSLYSRNPAIGVLEDTDEEVKKIIFDGTNDIKLYTKTQIMAFPFWRSIESRFFPKCREFNQISHHDRMQRYTPIGKFDFRTKQFDKVENSLFISDEMLRDQSVANRVAYLSFLMDVPLEWYVKRIEDYYSTKALLTLSKFYEYQQQISQLGDDHLYQLVNCYPEAVREFHEWFEDNVKSSVDFMSFGVSSDEVDTYLFKKFRPYFMLDRNVDWLDFDLSKYRLSISSEYQRFEIESKKKLRNSVKTKRLNGLKGVI